MTDDVKTCSRCGETKPVDDFHLTGRNHSNPEQRRGECKPCRSALRQDHEITARSQPNPLIVQREEWQQQGACRGKDPNLFFARRGRTVDAAKTICRTCPVQFACLDYAVRTGEETGVWGGKSGRQLQQIQRRRREMAA